MIRINILLAAIISISSCQSNKPHTSNSEHTIKKNSTSQNLTELAGFSNLQFNKGTKSETKVQRTLPRRE